MGDEREQQLLALSDDELFRRGACHIFADELYQQLASKGFVLRRIAEGHIPRFQAYHIYVARGDTAIDYRGITTESALIAECFEFRRRNNYPWADYRACPCDPKTLFAVCKEIDEPGTYNCWHHRIGDDFVQDCRRRAR